jgi:hypothetical protein
MKNKAAVRPPKVRGMAGSRSEAKAEKMGWGAHLSPPYNCREPGGRNEAARRFASVFLGLGCFS